MNLYRLKKFAESFFIVGFMATGKSSIGKILAKELDRPFLDLDEYIAQKEGCSIKEIFNSRGEEIRREGILRELKARITDVQQGPDGNLYVLVDEEDGALLRLEPLM